MGHPWVMQSFPSTVGPEQVNKPPLVEGDEDGEAEAEDEDWDEEVAVGEDGLGALGFIH